MSYSLAAQAEGASAGSNPVNLDLSSTQQSLQGAAAVGSGQVTINVGGSQQTITGTSVLTPAEYLAALQVASTGQQSITLGAQGNAVGGTFTANSLNQPIGSLVVPTGVTAVHDFGLSQTLNLTGNLVNSGNFYTVSSQTGVSAGTLSAASIINQQGALISSVLPAAGLAGFNNLLSQVSLNLVAMHDILNYGTIASSASLNLTAGNSIVNATTANVTAVMQAVNNINMIAANITNSGLINAATGNINIASQTAQNILINNAGGRLEALSGLVNVRDAAFAGKYNLDITGGDILSKALNLYSGDGIINVNAGDITGITNIYGGEAHVTAASANLSLGDVMLTGDPTFYNLAGNVNLNGNIVVNGDLAVVAARNIADSNGSTISTNNSGGNILMVAGADFTSTGPNSPSGADTTSTLTLANGGSVSGGSITLSSHNLLSTARTTAGTSGGDVTLVAWAGSGSGSGTVNLTTPLAIVTGGAGTGANGHVLIIAGANSGTSIQTGAITTTGGTGGGGSVGIYAATPTITGGSGAFVNAIGILNGSVLPGSGMFAPGALRAATINTTRGDIVSAGNVTIQGAGSISGAHVVAGGQGTQILLDVSAGGGRIDMGGLANDATAVNTSGGTIIARSNTNILNIGLGSGNIDIRANGNGTGNGGTINLTALNSGLFCNDVFANGGAGGGNGGTITISTNAGSGQSGDIGNLVGIQANGGGTGNGGTINVSVNGNSSFGVNSTASFGNEIIATQPGAVAVSANGGSAGGAGGSITLANTGSGGMRLQSTGLLSVSTSGGDGGSIALSTTGAGGGGTLVIPGGGSGLSVNAAANGDGGSITLTAPTLSVTGGALALRADGAGDGNGGTVTVTTTAVTGDITVGNSVGNLTIAATGGTSSGNGGTVNLSAGRNLIVDPAYLQTAPLGTNGNGATISLSSGGAGQGNLQVSGSLSADGVGTGNGGTIDLTSNSTTPFSLNTPSANGINGSTTVDGGEEGGAGGTVQVVNRGTGGAVVDFSQLSNYTGDTLQIGSLGVVSDIVITNNCNQCFNNLQSVVLETGGRYIATGTSLTLSPQASFAVTATNGIFTGSVSGGRAVSFETQGSVTVDGNVVMPGGSVTFSGATFNFPGTVRADGQGGSVTVLPTRSTTIDVSGLSHITTGHLQIGDGIRAGDLTFTGAGDLSGVSGQLNINLNGAYRATGSRMTLSPSADLTVAASSINTGNIEGGRTLSFNSRGQLAVDGDINMPGGSITLAGTSFSVPGSINAEGGQVAVLPAASTVLGLGDLSRVRTATLSIGDGVRAGDLTFTGTGDLSGVSGQLNVNLNGAYRATGSRLTLNENAALSIEATTINTGNISGGRAITASAAGALTVDGNLTSASAAIRLTGDTSLRGLQTTINSGISMIGSAIDVSSGGGDIVSGGSLESTVGAVALASGRAVSLLDASSITARQDLTVSARREINIGSTGGSGVTLDAGLLSGNPTAGDVPLPAGSVQSGGSLLIDNYRGGSGAGAISIGDNVVLTARGGGTRMVNGSPVLVPGDLGVHSAGDINLGNGSQLSSWGGDVWLNATNNVTLGRSTLSSYAKIDDNDTTSRAGGVYASLPAYTGGRIGIMVGAPTTDMSALLSGMAASRTGADVTILPAGGSGFDTATNTINQSGGSTFQVVMPAGGAAKTIANSTFNLSGGLMYIDPPNQGNDVNISGATLNAIGPRLAAPQPAPGTGGVTLSSTSGLPGSAVSGSATQSSTPALTAGSLSALSPASSLVPGDTTKGSSSTNSPASRPAIYCTTPTLLKATDTIDDTSWIMAASKCQPFAFEMTDGSLIIGSGPAYFAPSMSHTLLLKEGKLLIIAGESIIVVRTPLCSVTIPVNSAATVEYTADGLSRVTNLAGGKDSVTITREGETIILSAAQGEQLVLAEGSIPDDRIVCQPDVVNRKVDSWGIRVAGLRGEKFRFNRTEMVSREELLNCTMGCFTKLQQDMLDQIRKSMLDETPRQLKTMTIQKRKNLISRASTSGSHLSPVGFGPMAPVLDLTVPQISTLTAATAIIKCTAPADITMEKPGCLLLNRGDALISTSKPTTVKAGPYTVQLNGNTVVLLSYKGDHLKVRNIFESRATSVTALINEKKYVGLQVGQELIVARQGASINRALGEEAIGRRHLHRMDMAGGTSVLSCEISLSSILQNTDILSALVRSDNPADKELSARIMKMAVALSIVTQSHGSYSMVGQ